jgi:hypothetical protein
MDTLKRKCLSDSLKTAARKYKLGEKCFYECCNFDTWYKYTVCSKRLEIPK